MKPISFIPTIEALDAFIYIDDIGGLIGSNKPESHFFVCVENAFKIDNPASSIRVAIA